MNINISSSEALVTLHVLNSCMWPPHWIAQNISIIAENSITQQWDGLYILY